MRLHNNGLSTTCLCDKATVKAIYVQTANILVQIHNHVPSSGHLDLVLCIHEATTCIIILMVYS